VASLLVLVSLYSANQAVSAALQVNVRNAAAKASQLQQKMTQLLVFPAAFNAKLVPANQL
jgi:hypothetical protein